MWVTEQGTNNNTFWVPYLALLWSLQVRYFNSSISKMRHKYNTRTWVNNKHNKVRIVMHAVRIMNCHLTRQRWTWDFFVFCGALWFGTECTRRIPIWSGSKTVKQMKLGYMVCCTWRHKTEIEWKAPERGGKNYELHCNLGESVRTLSRPTVSTLGRSKSAR